jgi:uracil-DNA glycosylase
MGSSSRSARWKTSFETWLHAASSAGPTTSDSSTRRDCIGPPVSGRVIPPPSQTFAAFELTPYDDVRVVILGQDPYPNPGDAHGLAFSVPAGVPKPPLLKNVHAELEFDLGEPAEAHGNLEPWAKQEVLLLNTALTVRAGSKEDRMVQRRWRWEGEGRETFTDAVVDAINTKSDRGVHPVG